MKDRHEIMVNGEIRAVEVGSTVADIVSEIGLAPERVAVERNRAVVPRDKWAKLLDKSRLLK